MAKKQKPARKKTAPARTTRQKASSGKAPVKRVAPAPRKRRGRPGADPDRNPADPTRIQLPPPDSEIQ